MRQIQLRLAVDDNQSGLHPICYHLCKAEYIDAARTIRWTCSETILSVTHIINGSVTQLEKALDSMGSVSNVEFTAIDAGSFYLQHTIAIGERARNVLTDIVECGVNIVPPITYRHDGTAAVKIAGPIDAIQKATTRLSESIQTEIEGIEDFDSRNEIVTSVLTKRQRDAIMAAVELGYYESPREAYVKDIANKIGCAESTAGEHLRKAETKLLRIIVGGRGRHNSETLIGSRMATPSLHP